MRSFGADVELFAGMQALKAELSRKRKVVENDPVKSTQATKYLRNGELEKLRVEREREEKAKVEAEREANTPAAGVSAIYLLGDFFGSYTLFLPARSSIKQIRHRSARRHPRVQQGQKCHSTSRTRKLLEGCGQKDNL